MVDDATANRSPGDQPASPNLLDTHPSFKMRTFPRYGLVVSFQKQKKTWLKNHHPNYAQEHMGKKEALNTT